MKKLLSTLLFLWVLSSAYCQAPDTLSPEKRARYKISRLKDNTKAVNQADFQSAFSAIADMAAKRIPFVTQKELRAGKADTAQVIYVNEGLRSGTFRYDPKSKATDDSSLVVVSGGRRYVREDIGYVRPEWFGANPDDDIDDSDAIQKMFNSATPKGVVFHFSNGVYWITKQINFKAVSQAPKWFFKIIMEGAGVGRTQIAAKPGFTGDMFVIETGPPSGAYKDNYITINSIEFKANMARRILLGTEVTSLKIYDCMFFGGEDCGIQLGVLGQPGGYSVYFKNNYHNGQAYGAGQINSLLRLYSARFFVIDGMESDGAKYSIEMLGSCDKNLILNSKLEGAKRAAILIDNSSGGGGGENQIINSTINPYTGLESKALFDGELNGIEINSRGGANSFNTVRGNLILLSGPKDLPFVGTAGKVTGALTVAATQTYDVKGQTSGAVGYLQGYDPKNNRIIIGERKGHFAPGETIVQGVTNATAVIATQVLTHSNAIKLTGGGGSNIISENRIRQLPEYGVYNESNNNLIANNEIEASNGIYSTAPTGVLVTGNIIYSPGGVAVSKTKGVLSYYGNRILGGSLNGVDEAYLSAPGGVIKSPNANGISIAGADGTIQAQFTPNKNLILQAGGSIKDDGSRLQVNGATSLNGTVTATSLPVYFDNAAATKGGLPAGAIFRTPTGDLKVKY